MSINLLSTYGQHHERLQDCKIASPRASGKFPDAGQAMVEFAFSISIFILLLFGLIGLAIVFFSWLSTANAAREGARYVIANPTATDEEIKTYICSTTVILGGSSANCNSIRQGASPTLRITIEPAVSARISNAQVNVKVEYQVPVPTLTVTFLGGSRLVFLGPIWVNSTAVMRIE